MVGFMVDFIMGLPCIMGFFIIIFFFIIICLLVIFFAIMGFFIMGLPIMGACANEGTTKLATAATARIWLTNFME